MKRVTSAPIHICASTTVLDRKLNPMFCRNPTATWAPWCSGVGQDWSHEMTVQPFGYWTPSKGWPRHERVCVAVCSMSPQNVSMLLQPFVQSLPSLRCTPSAELEVTSPDPGPVHAVAARLLCHFFFFPCRGLFDSLTVLIAIGFLIVQSVSVTSECQQSAAGWECKSIPHRLLIHRHCVCIWFIFVDCMC